MPPDQIMVGLALFLTLFIMMPVFTEMNEKAIQPYINQQIQFKEAIKLSWKSGEKFYASSGQ